MELKKLNEAIESLETECKKKIKVLRRDYAFSNQEFKAGDIIEANGTILRVDLIQWYNDYGNQVPRIVYKGNQLTKKLVPYKKPQRAAIYTSSHSSGVKLLEVGACGV